MNYIFVGYKCFKNNDNFNKYVFVKIVLYNLVCIFGICINILEKRNFYLKKK